MPRNNETKNMGLKLKVLFTNFKLAEEMRCFELLFEVRERREREVVRGK